MNTKETSPYYSLFAELHSMLLIIEGLSVEEDKQVDKIEIMAAMRNAIFDVARRHIEYSKAQLALPD